jgi:hypothetical protein
VEYFRRWNMGIHKHDFPIMLSFYIIYARNTCSLFTVYSEITKSTNQGLGNYSSLLVLLILICLNHVTHACRKRRLKWVTTLPLGDINTEAWSSGMGVGRGANNPTL